MQQTKQYNYKQSPLYKLSSKQKLATLLILSTSDLDRLENLTKNNEGIYSVFTVGDKKREIQNPVHRLLVKTQKRLFVLLKRFELPDYVMSGKKGISYISNAELHKDSKFVLTMDIEHFYATTKGEFVFQFFLHKMEMASDLAHILTNISTYRDPSNGNRKIPTGSVLSQLLAFWAYSDMFNSISKLARKNNYIFSLYVDDMTFSSNTPIPRDFHKSVEEILNRKKLRFKRSKIRYYNESQPKKITGLIITSDSKICIPNKRLKETSEAIGKALSPLAPQSEKASALGKINSIQQIMPQIFKKPAKQISK
jgi:hypothetical protein